MRIAIVSDVHGNATALEAVAADLRQTSPDLILHGGDLPHGGASPAEIVDRIRDFGWAGVVGNTDELLFRPESLTEFAALSPAVSSLVTAIQAMSEWTVEALGPERIAWLRSLPAVHRQDGLALLHASPGDTWRAPAPEASDVELSDTYQLIGAPLAVYAHIHRPFVRTIGTLTVANTGSAGLPYDGDRRASYLLIDDGVAAIRRVEYDVEREIKTLASCGMPHAAWVSGMLATARPQMP